MPATNFDSTKTELTTLLAEIAEGKIQLPDFQRGWIWDDEHIRSLLVSVARSFPIGAIMLLETGGNMHFQERPVGGVALPKPRKAEKLILDGQQRLTSLTQTLRLLEPVTTKDSQGKLIKLHYYFDIDKALDNPVALEEAIVAVGEDRLVRKNFGKDIVLDLSSRAQEYKTFHFPLDQTLNANAWLFGLMEHSIHRVQSFLHFQKQVLEAFTTYSVPVIELKKETTKEAVCLVFEKVNTGGVPLSVFELVTATYAADDFNLRREWYGEPNYKGRTATFAKQPLLRDLSATEFLQGLSLLQTYEHRQADLQAGKTGKNDVTAVSAKREHVLELPLDAYKKWAEPLTQGFLQADQFLRHLGFNHPKFLPYRAQIIPIAAVLTHFGDRWLEPQIQGKLTQWFWCGVFGELYGSASETRIALDLQQLLAWCTDAHAALPRTVVDAGFQASRLDTMRSRTSAAYRGLYILLQQHGARDLFWKAPMLTLQHNDKEIDIHHIFPKKWCEAHDLSPRVYDSIVNKTAISAKANKKIGGSAPSAYLQQLQADKAVQIGADTMDDLLRSHLIEPATLRADDFRTFFDARREKLLHLVLSAMGKRSENPIA